MHLVHGGPTDPSSTRSSSPEILLTRDLAPSVWSPLPQRLADGKAGTRAVRLFADNPIRLADQALLPLHVAGTREGAEPDFVPVDLGRALCVV